MRSLVGVQFDGAYFDALVAWATGAHPATKTAPQRRQPDGLSQREIEMLGLLARRGLSNPQIAQALFITRKTVEHHLEHIYTKLGLSCRTAAATYAVQHRLA
jgi:DNA-binding NarL/FixJ family response regulator